MSTVFRPFLLTLPLLIALVAGDTAAGAEVYLDDRPRMGFIGAPLTITLEIEDAQTYELPTVPSVDGLTMTPVSVLEISGSATPRPSIRSRIISTV